MNIKRFIPIIFLPLFLLLFVPAAKAEPTMPPSEECLTLTEEMLSEARDIEAAEGFVTDEQERELWQGVVDAGCLQKNPIQEIKATKQCSAYLGQATAFLAPANAALAPFQKRVNALNKRYIKTSSKLYKQLERAEKRDQKNRVRALKRKIRKFERNYGRSFDKIVTDSSSVSGEYQASVVLVYADIYTRGCKVSNAWYNKNAAAFLALYYR